MGEAAARTQQSGKIFALHQGEVGRHRRHRLRTESDVEQLPFAHARVVLGKEKGKLGQLQAQRQTGTDDVRRHIVSIILAHQPRGDINGDHRGGRGVDVLHHGGKASAQWFVQPATEETVYHYVLRRQGGRGKLGGHLVELHARHIRQPFPVRLAVGRELALRVEEIRFGTITLRCQKPGEGEGIAAIVPRPGKDGKRSICAPSLDNGTGQFARGTFHQVDGGDGFTFDGHRIKLLDARCRKYLHHRILSF